MEEKAQQSFPQLGAVSVSSADVDLPIDLSLLADVRCTDCFPQLQANQRNLGQPVGRHEEL